MSNVDPTLAISVENPVVEVGFALRGRLSRAGELDDLAEKGSNRARQVRIRLHWYSEGRGDKDSRTVSQTAFPLDQYGRMNGGFELHVPPVGPISYDGKLMRVIWELEARTDIKFRTDHFVAIPILVIPSNGFGLYRAPHPLRH